MELKNLNFKKIFSDAENLIFSANDSYIRTYPEFIKYFEKINHGEINEHNLIIASHFVYGWMPTIIHLNLNEKDKVIFLLNAVKAGHILDISELNILKSAINNSIVGLSKLLHFINPINYAIWDSRIFRYTTGKKSIYGLDKPGLYLEYLKGIDKISKHKNFEDLHTLISRYFDYEINPTRVIEIIMFETERTKTISSKKELLVQIDTDKLTSEKTSNHLKQIEKR
jgi:hypothetical protein